MTRLLIAVSIVNGLIPLVLIWVNAVTGISGEWATVGFTHFVLSLVGGAVAAVRVGEGV